ncbi:MAG: hypothetical protein ACR2JB_01445 [Bryobacteraceae bacterium]
MMQGRKRWRGPGSGAGSSALKQIDQAALQTMMDKTAKELLIPGAVILLRTPQGEFTVTYGTTLLGAISPLRANVPFARPSVDNFFSVS